MSWSMIETCMRKQGGTAFDVVPTDYQTSDTLYHAPHGERIDVECLGLSAPNLLLWNGVEHRPVLMLKDDE